MAFFAVLTLVPSTIAVGRRSGSPSSVFGAGTVAQAEEAAIAAVRMLMGPQLADNVIAPFVHAQLAQPHGTSRSARCWSPGGYPATCSWRPDTRSTTPTACATTGATVVQRFIALAFALGSVARRGGDASR